MRFFLDNCVALAMARGIGEFAKAQGIEVAHLTDRFQPNTPDVDWIVAIRGEGWVLISGDTRITKNPVERAVWQESRLTAYFLDEGWARRRFWVQAAELVRWCPIIVESVRSCPEGSGFRLPFQGTAPKLIYTPS